jgi:phosphatidylserine decarboxylase
VYRRRNPFVAHEGVAPLALVAVLGVVIVRYASPWLALIPAILFGYLFLLFRDPERPVPAVALGVVSPADGEVVSVEKTEACVLPGETYRIRIRINSFGTYTARSPVEGTVRDLRADAPENSDCPSNALWVRTDEGADVVLQFHGYRFGIAPRSFVGFGQRIGQGHRCAYLRLAKYADVYMPATGQVSVAPGDMVLASSDVLGSIQRR